MVILLLSSTLGSFCSDTKGLYGTAGCCPNNPSSSPYLSKTANLSSIDAYKTWTALERNDPSLAPEYYFETCLDWTSSQFGMGYPVKTGISTSPSASDAHEMDEALLAWTTQHRVNATHGWSGVSNAIWPGYFFNMTEPYVPVTTSYTIESATDVYNVTTRVALVGRSIGTGWPTQVLVPIHHVPTETGTWMLVAQLADFNGGTDPAYSAAGPQNMKTLAYVYTLFMQPNGNIQAGYAFYGNTPVSEKKKEDSNQVLSGFGVAFGLTTCAKARNDPLPVGVCDLHVGPYMAKGWYPSDFCSLDPTMQQTAIFTTMMDESKFPAFKSGLNCMAVNMAPFPIMTTARTHTFATTPCLTWDEVTQLSRV